MFELEQLKQMFNDGKVSRRQFIARAKGKGPDYRKRSEFIYLRRFHQITIFFLKPLPDENSKLFPSTVTVTF